ncbi:putative nuclease HARBI1 [Engraulis encrasicolus]|uniref:putative nuclease HARBI1 n=1 Tax=Engraulis encrasicolus TaxID=184585 RepID=UPI002FD24311
MPPLHLLALLRQWQMQHRRRARIYRPRIHILGFTDTECLQRFRLDRAAILYLCQLLDDQLSSRSVHPHNLPVLVKVCAALSVLASGSFQRVAGDAIHISQASVCRCLNQFIEAMLLHTGRFIQFPTTAAERRAIKAGFYRVAGFPNVLGAIDCTHVSIRAPAANEHVYRDRRRRHSMNVQVVCDHTMLITSVCAKFPGSAHDAYILRNSTLHPKMERLANNGVWLIGDRGHPLMPWLMTPFVNPPTAAEVRYNNSHASTRSIIERTFGVLKSRFRCLDDSGGCLLVTPGKVCRMTTVCCMLHNMAVRRRLPMPVVPPQDPQDPDMDEPDEQPVGRAVEVRQQIVDQYFR